MIIGFGAFMVFLAFILALWEIQIEGKDGWAAKLPCWRLEKGWLVKLTGGRPITGYHLFMTLFLIAMVHMHQCTDILTLRNQGIYEISTNMTGCTGHNYFHWNLLHSYGGNLSTSV
jgi:hypothetical protein